MRESACRSAKDEAPHVQVALRRLAVVCLAWALCVLFLSGCAENANASEKLYAGKPPAGAMQAAVHKVTDSVEAKAVTGIVCWGDSMTYGVGADRAIIKTDDGTYDASYQSYPEILG